MFSRAFSGYRSGCRAPGIVTLSARDRGAMGVDLVETGEDRHSLAVLGISGIEERIYRYLVGRNGVTQPELAGALGLGKRACSRWLEQLAMMGLVRHSPETPRRYFASPPDLAIEALILKQQEAMQHARVTARALQEAAITARQGGAPEQMVELIATRDGERLVFEQLYLGATREVVTLMRLPMRVSKMTPPYDLCLQRQTRDRGVRFRTLIDGDFLEAPGSVGYLHAEMAAGVEARTVPHLPFKLVMADRRVAIIPLKLEQSDSHILVVRSSALLDALYALFEILWQRGAPVGGPSGASPCGEQDRLGLGPDSDALLSLMTLGMNDKAIAAELAISLRTLERRVQALMKALGARTRFQAGYLLARLPDR